MMSLISHITDLREREGEKKGTNLLFPYTIHIMLPM